MGFASLYQPTRIIEGGIVMKRLMLLLTITVASWTLTVNAAPKTIVTDGLLCYWTFDKHTINDGKVKDVWGENDATIVGNPKIADGYLKQGLELDGLEDYVSLPNFGNFGSRIGPYTFEVWFKTNNKKSWSAIYKVNELTCGRNNMGFGILINAWRHFGNNEFVTKEDCIAIDRSRNVGNGCAGHYSIRCQPISAGEWHHIVYTTRESTQEELTEFNLLPAPKASCLTSYVYFDNEPIGSSVLCVAPNDDIKPYTKPIFLGAVNDLDKTVGFFQGVFDEVRIYDRALTQEEVSHNYKPGIGLSVDPIQKLPTVWGALKAKR